MDLQDNFRVVVFNVLQEGGMVLLELPRVFYGTLANQCDEAIPEMQVLKTALVLEEDLGLLAGFASLRIKSSGKAVIDAVEQTEEALRDRYQASEEVAHTIAVSIGDAIARTYGIEVELLDDADWEDPSLSVVNPYMDAVTKKREERDRLLHRSRLFAMAVLAAIAISLAIIGSIAFMLQSGIRLLPKISVAGSQNESDASLQEGSTSLSPVAVAYNDLLDRADSVDYSDGWNTPGPNADNATYFTYALVEMTGDDVPELMLGANSEDGSRYLIYYFDPATGLLTQVLFHPITWGDDPNADEQITYGRSADGHGLVRYTKFADGTELYELITIKDGEETYEVHGLIAYTSLGLRRSSDRSALKAL